MLSVCPSLCDAQQKCLNRWIGSALLGSQWYNFQPPTPTLSPQTPHPQNFQCSMIGYLSNSWTSCDHLCHPCMMTMNQQSSCSFALTVTNSHEHANDVFWWTVSFLAHDRMRLEGGSCIAKLPRPQQTVRHVGSHSLGGKGIGGPRTNLGAAAYVTMHIVIW